MRLVRICNYCKGAHEFLLLERVVFQDYWTHFFRVSAPTFYVILGKIVQSRCPTIH